MSDITSPTRWMRSSEKTAWRKTWLAGLVGLVAFLVFANLAGDAALDVKYGWDIRVNCAAVDAHVDGLDPYFVKNLKGTKLSYPYLPVTLDVFRPLCAGGFLVGHYRSLFLALAALCGLLLPGLGQTLGRARPRARDVALRVLCALGAFIGYEWVQATGNFAVLSGLLTAIALQLLFRPSAPGATEDPSYRLRLAGAALLGLVTSFKLVFLPVLAALYFLPLRRGPRLALIAVAAVGFALPILISRLLYPDLFASWQLAMARQIPDQHVVDLFEINPSLLLLARDLMDHAGLGGSKAAAFAVYALFASALVLVPFVMFVLRLDDGRPARDGGSLLARLDRWLINHPRTAMRITVLAMFALYLSSPRLKEYAYFELALYAAILVVDLTALALAAFLVVGLAFPAVISLLGMAFEGSFILLIVALLGYWILLLDFRAEPKRLETEGAQS